MAVQVSHAMRRHLAGPAEPPFMYPVSEANVYTGGGLSQSMRYAETWLYGVQPAQSGLILPYPPSQPLVVLCTCAGTKRSSKKSPSVCKKCKGTIIHSTHGTVRGHPQSTTKTQYGGTMRGFSQIGGTVRGFSKSFTSLSSTLGELGNRGYHTVRENGANIFKSGSVRPNVKSRPSIFDLDEIDTADPYDLMRRSRLVSPAETRQRTKSISPHRGRTRRRSPSPIKYRSRSANRTDWIDPDSNFRKSILECDVNPYELMGKNGLKDSVDDLHEVVNLPNYYEDVEPDVHVKKQSRNYEPISVTKEKKLKSFKELARPVKLNESKPLPERPPRKSKPEESEIAVSSSKFESNSNRFKSILKKTSTFNESESNYDRIPSPVVQTVSGSHFYLPSPTLMQLHSSAPRKKVQFLENVKFNNKNLSDDEEKSRDIPTETTPSNDATTAAPGNDDLVEKTELQLTDPTQDATKGPTKLRRSLSDRTKPSCRNSEPEIAIAVQFNDTMALRRGRASHLDHREVFSALQRLDGVPLVKISHDEDKDMTADNSARPREPPPPPPTPPVAPARKKQDRKKKVSLDSVSSSADSNHSGSSSDSFQSLSSTSGDSCFHSDSDNSNNAEVQIVTVNKSAEPENVRKISVEFTSEKKTEFKPLVTSSPSIITINPNKPNPNITSVTLNNSEPTTIVQISPLTVHRLKIKNEFNEEEIEIDNSQRKTSIMITGDDCYSTVNVNDDVPLYQSSVVVNDSEIPDSRLYTSSSVYISCTPEKYEPVSNTVISINDDFNPELSSSELTQLLKDPVEAVKRNLVPHVCGKTNVPRGPKRNETQIGTNVVAKLLRDPELGSLVEGLESDVIAKLIQESLLKLKQTRFNSNKLDEKDSLCSDGESNVNSLNSGPYEQIDNLDDNDYSSSNRSSLTEDDLASTSTRSKFYQLLVDASLDGDDRDEHQYESIRLNQDPIYEEIEMPPPLPLNPPPDTLPEDNLGLDKSFTTRSIFEGASKYDILSYLVDARERGIESYAYSFANSGSVVIECENEILTSGEDTLKATVEVERTDSGVGSESSKSSRSRYQQNGPTTNGTPENSNPCEDCNLPVDTQVSTGDVVYTPLVCRKCSKRRAERKEIITEIVETEEKYARDLQIILEEFYQPMLVAGLLNAEQLSAVFLNVEELLENSQSFGERLRDALEIAIEQGDEDLLTVDVGRLFLDASPMLHSFESYCVRQAAAGLLLANLEKEKELLRIFLKVSQMENTVLRRMNLNSFLMVPVQRVTKYPLLLARLNKVTPSHLDEMKELLTEAQRLVEQHLGQMNASAKDVPSRLWRRLSSGRRTTSELDSVNIKLRKLAVDILEWNHEEARFALEGKLLYTQPIDSAWRRGRTIKLTPICALLVTLGRPGVGYKSPDEETLLAFPRQTGIREAALVLARDKGGRYSLLREPLYLDRCVVATDPAWQSYFEVQELLSKDTFIFKAEDDARTITWYRHLQYHAQGMGTWRKRRNALANIMITGISGRS